jgi:hypothetical protein
MLKSLNRNKVKRFFDRLCSLLDRPWKVLWQRHPL